MLGVFIDPPTHKHTHHKLPGWGWGTGWTGICRNQRQVWEGAFCTKTWTSKLPQWAWAPTLPCRTPLTSPGP